MKDNTNYRYNRSDIKADIQKYGKATRSIAPSTSYLDTLESSGYKIFEAICDITDNSWDAGATFVNVTLKEQNKRPYLVISDDGCGMPEDILFGAMVLGASIEELKDYTKNGGSLGKFGSGMKAALAQLRGITTLLTKIETDGKLYKLVYDKKLLKKKDWFIDVEVTEDPKDIEFFNQETNNSSHGTVIQVSDIKGFNSVTSETNNTRKAYSRIFRKFLNNGKTIRVNGEELKPVDPMLYYDPITEGGQIYKSEILTDTYEIDNIKYEDKDGKIYSDGKLKYTSYLIPTEALELSNLHYVCSWTNQGISVLRNGREICFGNNWFGLRGQSSPLSRLRIEIEFESMLDNVMGVDYRKTTIEPQKNQSLMDQIRGQILSDITQTEKLWKRDVKYTKNNTTVKGFVQTWLNKMKSLRTLLPMIPMVSNGNKTDITRNRPNFPDGYDVQRGMHYDVVFDGKTWGEFDRFFEGGLNGKKVQIVINTNHRFYTEYLQPVSQTQSGKDSVSAFLGIIYGFIHAKYQQIPQDSKGYLERMNNIETIMGQLLHTTLSK